MIQMFLGVMASAAVRRIHARRLAALPEAERRAVAALCAAGLGTEWHVRTVVSAVAKTWRVPAHDAAARVRAGMMRAWAAGRLAPAPGAQEILKAFLTPA